MTARLRLLLLCVAALVLWQMRDRLSDTAPGSAQEQPAKGKARAQARSAPPARAPLNLDAELCQTRPPVAQRAEFAAAVLADPFAAKRAVAASPAPAPAKVAVVSAPVAVEPPSAPPPPPPPPLPKVPYRYLGMVNEKGEPAKVFMALGGALLTARAGDHLEGGFRLDSISPRELVFTHLQQQKAVRFGIDGDTQ